MRVVIIGAGGHAQVVADILLRAQQQGNLAYPVAFLDENATLWGQHRLGVPILGALQTLTQIAHEAVIVAIGNNRVRAALYNSLKNAGEHLINTCHPSAIIAHDVVLGSGCVICAGVIINTGTIIGDNVIINTASSVDHHNTIGDHVHIAPGVHLGGDVTLGEGALVGIAATVMPQRKVGNWSVVGAAALVHRNVGESVTVVGVPARQIEK